MQSAIQIAERNDPPLAIIPPAIDRIHRIIEIGLGGALERQAPLSDVPLVLGRVEVNFHSLLYARFEPSQAGRFNRPLGTSPLIPATPRCRRRPRAPETSRDRVRRVWCGRP